MADDSFDDVTQHSILTPAAIQAFKSAETRVGDARASLEKTMKEAHEQYDEETDPTDPRRPDFEIWARQNYPALQTARQDVIKADGDYASAYTRSYARIELLEGYKQHVEAALITASPTAYVDSRVGRTEMQIR
jgi:hypothetical protein